MRQLIRYDAAIAFISCGGRGAQAVSLIRDQFGWLTIPHCLRRCLHVAVLLGPDEGRDLVPDIHAMLARIRTVSTMSDTLRDEVDALARSVIERLSSGT